MKNHFFSIIIPTFNRNDQLINCLHCLSLLNYPSTKFEVIVVNDGGEKPLDDVVAPFKGKINIVTIYQSNAGPASARNHGARLAKGDYFAFIDDDCQPHRDWLMLLEESLTRTPDCLIGGKTLNLLKHNIYSTASQIIVELAYRHYNKNPKNATFFSSNNIALSKQKFLEVGGFDEKFRTAEDRDLCKRWQNKGLKLIYARDAFIYHAHELNFFTFAKQHFNYGRGSFLFYNKNSHHGSQYFSSLLRFNLNPKNLFVYPFSNGRGLSGFSIVFLLLFWQLSNAAGFCYEFINQKIISRNPLSLGKYDK